MNTYNKKAFLLPDSINSCSMYHAKIFEDGKYIFRIHDCLTGIRFRGDLNTQTGVLETCAKINQLIGGLDEFRDFVFDNYFKKEKES